MKEKIYTACVIVIGNEILSGRTQDVNIAYLANRLNGLGVRLCEARIIADDETAIVEALNACRVRYDYVFTTGGIGPTHDDITPACIAKAFDRPLVRNAEAEAVLRSHYGRSNINEARLSMANLPEGAKLIDNPVSRAPGFQIENVFVLAGVPVVARAMFENLADHLKGGTPVASRTVSALVPEGEIAGDLASIQARYSDVDIGSYPFIRHGRLGVSIVARGTGEVILDSVAQEAADLMRARGADPSQIKTN